MTLRALAEKVRTLPRWDWNRHTQQGYPMIESDGGLYLDRGSVLRLIEQAAAPDGLDGLRKLSESATPGPWRTEVGTDSVIVRADGSRINVGDAIYHPTFVADGMLIVAAVNFVRDSLAATPSHPATSETVE